jgi:protein phosphatase
VVDLGDEGQVGAASKWWEELTAASGERMVLKPCGVLHQGPRGLASRGSRAAAVGSTSASCTDRSTAPENLARLRSRAVGPKRSLALRELALGLEGLHRFVDREPLHRVHECVVGVLALEPESVDPRR